MCLRAHGPCACFYSLGFCGSCVCPVILPPFSHTLEPLVLPAEGHTALPAPRPPQSSWTLPHLFTFVWHPHPCEARPGTPKSVHGVGPPCLQKLREIGATVIHTLQGEQADIEEESPGRWTMPTTPCFHVSHLPHSPVTLGGMGLPSLFARSGIRSPKK